MPPANTSPPRSILELELKSASLEVFFLKGIQHGMELVMDARPHHRFFEMLELLQEFFLQLRRKNLVAHGK